jgi:hypothetical protein
MATAHSRPGRTPVYGALPLTLLGLFALRHYGYEAFPDVIGARVWNIHGAIVMLVLLAWVTLWMLYLSPAWGKWTVIFISIAAWWAVEELMVIGCNTWWILSPWLKPAGASACYPILHFDIGKIGALVAVGALAHLVHRNKV